MLFGDFEKTNVTFAQLDLGKQTESHKQLPRYNGVKSIKYILSSYSHIDLTRSLL